MNIYVKEGLGGLLLIALVYIVFAYLYILF